MSTPPTLCSRTVSAPRDGACLLVHGGAWDIPLEEHPAHREGLEQALDRGRALLLAGGSALEAVTETVATMESHGAFDAGRGGVLTRDGHVELDAGVMDGATLDWGAVACVKRLANPIRLAAHLATHGGGQARLLVADGAEALARAAGFSLIDNASLICERERARFARLRRDAARFHASHPFLPDDRKPSGTVGSVARDRRGRLAAATSTGGTPFSPPGRVGDSPLCGAGYYANAHAAAGATGWGEAIATTLLSVRAADAVARGGAVEDVARDRLDDMRRRVLNREGRGATGGLILLDRHGTGAWAYTTPRMARGGWAEGGEAWAEI